MKLLDFNDNLRTSGYKYFSYMMFFCCIGYAVFKTANRSIGDVFQTLVFISGIFYFTWRFNEVRKEPVFWILMFSILISISGWLSSVVNFPESARDHPRFGDFSYFMFFIFLALWLKESRARIIVFWVAFSLGGLLTIITHSNNIWLDIIKGVSGERIDFEFINANHSAAIFGSILILNVWLFLESKSLIRLYRPLLLVFSLSMMAASAFVVLVTQSRQVWLAIVLSLIVVVTLAAHFSFKKILTSYLLVFMLLVLFWRLDVVQDRLEDERQVIDDIKTLNIHAIPYTSIGVRVHLAYESVSWIVKYPLFGAGPDARALVIKTSDSLPDFVVKDFTHLHNGYLDILVCYGVLGLLFFIFLFYCLSRYSSQQKVLEHGVYLWSAFLVFFCVINFYESFLMFKTGQYMVCCVAAGVYAAYLQGNNKQEDVTF